MNGTLITLELTVGAAILALWTDARIGGRRPSSLGRRMAHTVVAFLVLQASSAALAGLVHDGTPRGLVAALLFAFFLPPLVYSFVVGLWLLRTFKEIVA